MSKWNVNGIQTFPKYHPWLNKKDYDEIWTDLGADIVCLQETKIVKSKITRPMACMPNHEAFFSSNRRLPPKGYSGTAIIVDHAVCMPLKAEEGLSGILQNEEKPMIPHKDRIGSYPTLSDLLNDHDLSKQEVVDLETEGRATLIDVGLFVLINVYCPAVSNEIRNAFKAGFNGLLEARIRALIAAGRSVILVGDINIVAQAIDHCDPSKSGGPDGFDDTSSRRWFQRMMGSSGIMVDVTRHFHPSRTGMFTCWEMRTNAREGNYGTRLDYILVTPDLMPWIKGSDIMATVKGSDHCPVYVEFHDEIVTDEGQKLLLWDLINPPSRSKEGPVPDAPTFSARNYPVFKQRNLTTLWSNPGPSKVVASPKKSAGLVPEDSPEEELTMEAALNKLRSVAEHIEVEGPAPERSVTVESGQSSRDNSVEPVASTSKLFISVVGTTKPESTPKGANPSQKASQPQKSESSQPSKSSGKTASSSQPSKTDKGKGKSKEVEQTSISSFFAPPPKKTKKKDKKRKASLDELEENVLPKKAKKKKAVEDEQAEQDAIDVEDAFDASDATAVVQAAEAWNSIFKPKKAPLCFHGEPCKEWEVNKPGPNKGRKFWLCQRPIGEGHGSRTLTEHRCEFFEFSTNVSRPYLVSNDAKARAKSK